MPTQNPPATRLEKLFRRRKCWVLADLAKTLDYALITVRRLLKQVGYFRSYTHNGKWYTLQAAPKFNPEGIWLHRKIGFSKRGSLTATITGLVKQSSAGLSARDLAEKLQHPCHAVLSILHKNSVLDRVKVGGEFRYLCPELPINHRQREQSAVQDPQSPLRVLSTQTALFVLVEHIKNPGLSFEQMATNVGNQRNITVAAESIDRFFAEHDLKKTSKTPTSER